MPYTEIPLPPLAGTIRAVALTGDFVVWTEHGLFRYELDPYPAVRYLVPADRMARQLDRATGQARWRDNTYQLVGDPAFVPDLPPEPEPVEGDDTRVEVDRKRRRVRVLAADGTPQLVVENFPTDAAWYYVTTGGWGNLYLIHPGGVRYFQYTKPPPSRQAKWQEGGSDRNQAALMTAILTAPDDDTPRLVYADWLEENGNAARAEFIRLQCRLAARERAAPIPDKDPDQARVDELWREHWSAWRGEYPKVRGVDWDEFWRGFPTVRVGSAVTLARAGKRLWESAPVQRAYVTDPEPDGMRTLAASPLLDRLRVLHLRTVWGGSGVVAELAASPRAAGLRGLRVETVDESDVRALAGSEHLTGLEWLMIRDTLRARGVDALVKSAGLPALRWLNVDRKGLPPDALKRLRKRFPKVTAW